MDNQAPPDENPSIEITPDTDDQSTTNPSKRLSNGCDESDADQTIHAFNLSNITVIEKPPELSKFTSHEGSDSGVEVLETPDICSLQRTLSTNSSNSQEFRAATPNHSCDSSIISCCSNYEEAYNLLARRNSSLLEDYKLRGDATSEGGSESSSVTGSNCSRGSKNVARKKGGVLEKNCKNVGTPRMRSKPPLAPKSGAAQRLQEKSTTTRQPTNRTSTTRTKLTPDTLNLNTAKRDSKRTSTRGSSTTRTPTDDGRWPSVNSKPAPLMTRSLRGILPTDKLPRPTTLADTKTIEKYATLPRRRKEKSCDSIKRPQKAASSRESSVTRTNLFRSKPKETPPMKSMPPYPRKKVAKTKIYHEIGSQTALTVDDIEKAFSGHLVNPAKPQDVDKVEKDVQVDLQCLELERVRQELKEVTDKYDLLCRDFKEQSSKLRDTEQQLVDEKSEKEGLKEELKQNTNRVLAILGGVSDDTADTSHDSLLVLETRYQDVSQLVIRQEEEISSLNSLCRLMKRDLDKSASAHKALLHHQQELEADSAEIQEFMKAEKNALTDALRETELEIKDLRLQLEKMEREAEDKRVELRQFGGLRQENVILKARIGVLEAKSREFLVHQGSAVSGAAVALSALIARLEGLIEEFVTSYNISEQELEDVIFHNEMYSNSSSSPETTPQKNKRVLNDKTPSPKTGSGFVSAVINAIKNATAQTPKDSDNDGSADRSCASEMLDSETEPCLMMDPVLEDVIIPDGYSHNMISSGHGMLNSRLSHSHSDLTHKFYGRQFSDQSSNNSFHSDVSSLSELCPSVSLVDQVIEVDNLVTRLLKVIRFIQLENEDCLTEVEEERDGFKQQVDKQREANKTVVKQLKDWEVLGARLKTEVKELLQQLSNKNNDIDNFKMDLNHQRKEVERLNQDVCELSTALSKTELESKMRDDEARQALKIWEQNGDVPVSEMLSRLTVLQKEMPLLRERLTEKEKQLSEVMQEYAVSRQFSMENLRDALGETRKLYEAIDTALETLHSIQSVVQQCPPLANLQRDLEETSFQTASAIPIVVPSDLNANAALMQAVANIEIVTPINTSA